MGSGRTEVARAIFGADPASAGEVRVGARRLGGSVRDAIARGMGFVTEDRKAQGLVLDSSAAANITLAVLGSLCRAGSSICEREAAMAEGYRDRLRIRLPSVQQPTRTLSGGNQQKVIIARWLAANCRVLILDEPTRGVDVGAKSRDLRAHRRAGRARGGHPAHLQRSARGAGPGRPGGGHARGQARRYHRRAQATRSGSCRWRWAELEIWRDSGHSRASNRRSS